MFGTLSSGPRQDLNKMARGYYRTDDATTQGVCNMLAPSSSEGTITIFDPCCGEGIVLGDLQESLRAQSPDAHIKTLGVEIEGSRFVTALSKLDQVVHGDALHHMASSSWASLLFFNPPYGMTKRGEKNVRLEQLFWEAHSNRLMPGGVLVAVLPEYLFYRESPIMVQWMSRYLEPGRTKIFNASTDQFKQIVIIGYRRIRKDGELVQPDEALQVLLDPDAKFPSLPETPSDDLLYRIPVGKEPETFKVHELTQETVQHILSLQKIKAFNQEVNNFLETEFATQQKLRSISTLREGHIPALLSSGVLDGIVEDDSGRFLVRGTVKTVLVTQDETVDDGTDDNTTKTSITRKHETCIMAWDMDSFELLEIA